MKNKKLLLSVAIVLLTLTVNAVPNGWKCKWNGPPVQTFVSMHGEIPYCKYERSMTCTHWFWGTRIQGYEWEKECTSGAAFDPNELPPNYDPEDFSKTYEFIANVFTDIESNYSISVPEKFKSADSLAIESIFEEATIYRLELAGFDIVDPFISMPCFNWEITLPIQVPHISEPDFIIGNCITVYPNPTLGDDFSVAFDFSVSFLTEIKLIKVSNGSIEYVKSSNFSSIEVIPITGLEAGLYKIRISTGEKVHYVNLVIQ